VRKHLEQPAPVRKDSEVANLQKELESFCYSVSHDLRAPLRSIDGFSNALLHEFGPKLEPQAREYLQRILDSSKKMASLIDELLSLSRIQRVEIAPEVVDLSRMAEEIIRGLRKTDPKRKISFVARPNMQARGDRKLVRVVLEKFLENAWKFTARRGATREGPGRIEFLQQNDGRTRVFAVRDNGVGFDPTYADRLFKIFQRLHPQADYPGLGTGLAMARAIVLRHGGRAWAESFNGKGATFFFTLGGEKQRKQINGVKTQTIKS